MNRRDAIRTAALAVTTAGGLRAEDAKPKRIAAVNSVYHKLSHAYHIAGRFLYGYTLKGKHHQPPFHLVRMFNDQYHADGSRKDLSRELAKKKNFAVADTIAAALGGKSSLDVDGVLLICEHGDYPRNKLGQILYPRAELFEQIVDVFKASGRACRCSWTSTCPTTTRRRGRCTTRRRR